MFDNPAYYMGRLAAWYNRVIGTPEYNIQQSTASVIMASSPKHIAVKMIDGMKSATIQPELQPLFDNLVAQADETLTDKAVLAEEIGIFLAGYRREKIILDAIPKSATKKKIKFT